MACCLTASSDDLNKFLFLISEVLWHSSESSFTVNSQATTCILHDEFNSLAPGKFEWNLRHVIFKQNLVIDVWGICCEIALIWMSLDFTDNQSTLVQVMFGAVRQQAITWAKVDPDLCRHMASLGPNELKLIPLKWLAHLLEYSLLLYDYNSTANSLQQPGSHSYRPHTVRLSGSRPDGCLWAPSRAGPTWSQWYAGLGR